MLTADMVSTVTSSWLSTATPVRTSPRSGLERDTLASATVARTRSLSPGRTGAVHRSSSMPGDARLATFDR